jgi:hypothetical protein
MRALRDYIRRRVGDAIIEGYLCQSLGGSGMPLSEMKKETA